MDYVEFFDLVGEKYIKTSRSGESTYVSIEELYQAFKARLVNEVETMHGDELFNRLGESYDRTF